jgi:hypothetical protein
MDEEAAFTLPCGYAGPDGSLHREGAMRRARAGDEIVLLQDPRVKGNRAYLVVLLLARVITRLGSLRGDQIDAGVIEGLYTADLAHLQDVYRKLNQLPSEGPAVVCPHCLRTFNLPG